MKKIIIYIVLLLFISLKGYSQAVVSDPTLLAESISNWGTQIKMAEENYKIFVEQTKIIRETAEKLQKVNRSIQTTRRIKSLLEQQQFIGNFLYREINNAKNLSVNYEVTAAYINRLNVLEERFISNMAYITDVLADGILNLSDADRLRELKEVTDENEKLMSKAVKEKERYEQTNEILLEAERLMNKK